MVDDSIKIPLVGGKVALVATDNVAEVHTLKISASGGGGGGTPGGSTTQLQYNNVGAFGGIIGATTDGTTLTLVAPVLGTPASGNLANTTGFPLSNLSGAGTSVLTALGINVGSAGAPITFNGALGTPSSGTLTNATGLPAVGGGTGQSTYAKGDILASPGSNTLNKLAVSVTDGHVLTVDVASTNGVKWAAAAGGGSAGGSDTQVQFNDGGTAFGGDSGLVYNKTTNALTLTGPFGASTVTVPTEVTVTNCAQLNTSGVWAANLYVGSVGQIIWRDSNSVMGGASDLRLFRDASNILAQRNGTAAQAFRVYNTYTDASNYERLELLWSSNIMELRTTQAGTGTARDLMLGAGGSGRWRLLGASGHLVAQTDNTYDIGASGATRPRDYFGAGKITSAGATAGLGYATGAGGTVTQATDRTTGVTLNKATGQITTTATSLGAITIVTFTVTNSAVAATDTIILSKVSGDIDTSCWVSAVASGSFNVSLRNNDAVSADTTAFVFNFAVIKGVTS